MFTSRRVPQRDVGRRHAHRARIGMCAILCAVALIGIGGWYKFSLLPMQAFSQMRTEFEVTEGSSVRQIAAMLYRKKLIRSVSAFVLYVRLHKLDSSLQAGRFLLRPSDSIEDIVSILQSGKAAEIAITIPEGFTVADIDTLLAQSGLSSTGAILACAQQCDFASFNFLPEQNADLAQRGGKIEGYLFPDTYYVPVNDFVPKFFLERLLSQFRKQVVTGLESELAASQHSLHEIITMASLLEEESRHGDERRMVAGILWKRLQHGVSLGVDATVRYVTGKNSDQILRSDLDIDSPYNTRKFTGLPPGPIASPGLESIRASLQPIDSEYWYYLHDRAGAIHYSKTNDEHNLARQRHLQ